MATRLLAAFDVLDIYSKKVNEQVHGARGQHVVYRNPDTPQVTENLERFGVERTNKLKHNSEIISEEDVLKRLRVPVATSLNNVFCTGSVELVSNRINIRPFINPKTMTGWTSATNIESSTGTSTYGEDEGVSMMPPKKPRTLQSSRQSPHRMKWSKEVEKIPCLYALNKDTSKALVGRCLGNINSSHWCTSLVNNDMTHGIVRTGKNCVKQLSHEQSSDSEEGVHFEPAPLSFDDELERKDVKVLTARPVNAYEALPIVSETYPVVYSTAQHRCEPFSSPGFHCLVPPEPSVLAPTVRQRTVCSAIVHITESMQAHHILQSQRRRQRGEVILSPVPYPASGPKGKRMGGNHTNLCVLSADGNVNRSLDLGRLPLHNHGHVCSAEVSLCTKKVPQIARPMPGVRGLSSTCVGPVINGMNPSQNCDPEKIPHFFSNPLQGTPWRRLNSSCHTSALKSQHNVTATPKNRNFLLFSKSKYRQNGVKRLTPKLQTRKEWGKEETEPQNLHRSCESQISDCESFYVHRISISRPQNSLNCDFQNTTPSGMKTLVTDHISASSDRAPITDDTECISVNDSSSAYLHRPQPIKIPYC
ncbi:uncharacterized protein LOC143521672 isoform X2 [Brachyhypopomus gauderio]|uniref:uncharacterized protein LOC143521672 isoform X2 n=1 Tax=Brachyhypopomus gauderio TaxID=698409 RepID=UPI004041FBC0